MKKISILVLLLSAFVAESSFAASKVLDSASIKEGFNRLKNKVKSATNKQDDQAIRLEESTAVDLSFYEELILEDLQNTQEDNNLVNILQEINTRLTKQSKAKLFDNILKSDKVSVVDVVSAILSTNTQNSADFVTTAMLSRPEMSESILLQGVKSKPQEAQTIIASADKYDRGAIEQLQKNITEGKFNLPNNLQQSVNEIVKKVVSDDVQQEKQEVSEKASENVVEKEVRPNPRPPKPPRPPRPQRTCITISNDVICE